MSTEKRYPMFIRKDGKEPDQYYGIIYNGDCCVYKQAVVKALKKAKCDKALIKEVMSLDLDLDISKRLIDNELYDILVEVYSDMDSNTAIMDYILDEDESISAKMYDERNPDYGKLVKKQ